MVLMGIPSLWELIIIFGVVFLLFGAKKLPELGGAIGESIKNFKKGIRDEDTPPVDPNRRLTEAKPAEPLPGQQAAGVPKSDYASATPPKDPNG